jgi:hypothetical protein
MSSEENTPLKIFYPSLRFDIDTPLQVAECWENEEVEIYTIVEFDPDHGKEDIEPVGMPMCLEKVQKYIKKYLKDTYEVLEFEEPTPESQTCVEVGEGSGDESSEGSDFDDDECWILKWKIKDRMFSLYYYFGFEPFGDYWPEKIDEIDTVIHTNGPVDLEDEEGDFVALLQERCDEADLYSTKEAADSFWPEANENYEFADDSDVDENNKEALYYLGEIKQYFP